MILIDANLLIYAYNELSPQHTASRQWLETTFSTREKVGLPIQSLLAFIRISTNAKLPGPHASVADALTVVDSWLELPTIKIIYPGPGHWEIFRELCMGAGAGGNLSTDAHMAALTIEHDGTLYTADADFKRFQGLRWQNPLLAV